MKLSQHSGQYKNSEFLNLCGIHLHIGSQNPELSPYADAFQMLFENLLKIYDETGLRLAHINLGGGFPVNYLRDKSQAGDFPEEQREMFSADFEPAEAVANAWRIVKAAAENAGVMHLLENITLLLEPGRSIISDAGVCLTTVRNMKNRPLNNKQETVVEERAKTEISSGYEINSGSEDSTNIMDRQAAAQDHWILTDAGFNILLSMETYKWYYHLISAERASEPHNYPYKLAGPLCDGGDVYFDIEGENRLPDYRLLPENIKTGEILALLNCGAYSIAQMFQYNGRFLPEIILVRQDGTPELIRRRDSFEDLINNDLW